MCRLEKKDPASVRILEKEKRDARVRKKEKRRLPVDFFRKKESRDRYNAVKSQIRKNQNCILYREKKGGSSALFF